MESHFEEELGRLSKSAAQPRLEGALANVKKILATKNQDIKELNREIGDLLDEIHEAEGSSGSPQFAAGGQGIAYPPEIRLLYMKLLGHQLPAARVQDCFKSCVETLRPDMAKNPAMARSATDTCCAAMERFSTIIGLAQLLENTVADHPSGLFAHVDLTSDFKTETKVMSLLLLFIYLFTH
jgi:hypothetical protein